MNPVHELIEADRGDLSRNHHDAEDEGEEGVTAFPGIGHERIGRQRGEVNGEGGGSDSDNQRVQEASPGVEGFAFENLEVVHQVRGRDQRNGMLLNLKGAARRVDDHDHKGEQAQNREHDTDKIDECFDNRISVASV